MKINKDGAFALIVVFIGSIVLIHDFIKLINGYSYTIVGFISTMFVLMLMGEAFKIIEDRLK